jgi:hypothetical protein
MPPNSFFLPPGKKQAVRRLDFVSGNGRIARKLEGFALPAPQRVSGTARQSQSLAEPGLL